MTDNVTADPQAGQACENTDRHLWPQVSKPDDPYESIHVTKEGAIGINVQGYVIVKPLREWHRLAGGSPGRGLPDRSEQSSSKEQFRPWLNCPIPACLDRQRCIGKDPCVEEPEVTIARLQQRIDGLEREQAAYKRDNADLREANDRLSQPPVAAQHEWKLTDEHINELQVASVDRLIKRAKQAHFVNVEVRINGQFETHEADWIKHMVRTGGTPTKSAINESASNGRGASQDTVADGPARLAINGPSPCIHNVVPKAWCAACHPEQAAAETSATRELKDATHLPLCAVNDVQFSGPCDCRGAVSETESTK